MRAFFFLLAGLLVSFPHEGGGRGVGLHDGDGQLHGVGDAWRRPGAIADLPHAIRSTREATTFAAR